MSRYSKDGKPFYVDVGTSMVAVRCASNHDVVLEYDHARHPFVIELAEKVCDRMNREVEILDKPMERIVRDAILSYEQLYKEAPNDDVEQEIFERCAIAQGWLVAHGFERQKVSFDKEESPNL